MAAESTRPQRNAVFGAFLATKGMTPDTPVSDPASFYEEWEDYLWRSVPAGTSTGESRGVDPNARPGSFSNPRTFKKRGEEY